MSEAALPIPPRPETRRYHQAAVWTLFGFFIAINLLVAVEAFEHSKRSREIADSTFTSAELLSKVEHDLDRERALVDEHVAEVDRTRLARLEARIAEAQQAYMNDAKAYEASADAGPERTGREAWQTLRQEWKDLRGPLEEVLVLSRSNDDDKARMVLGQLDGRFESVAADIEELRATKRFAAERLVAQSRATRNVWLLLLPLVTFLGLGTTTALGWSAVRLLARRDDELRRVALQLEERNRDLDAFAGRVAHDLRAPLATISLAAAKLEDSAPQVLAVTQLLHRTVKRMGALINDLLSLARVDSTLEHVECEPGAVTRSMEEDLVQRVGESGGVVRVEVEPAKVHCSEGFLRQVVWNLVENAVKFRRADVPLEVLVRGASRDRTVYDLSVTDNGIGFLPEEASRAFEPFFRGTRGREGREGGAIAGTGLGLSIVQRIAEACGGRASLRSREGDGTTVSVHLPLTPAT
jgi:signal transduction histidine kinase